MGHRCIYKTKSTLWNICWNFIIFFFLFSPAQRFLYSFYKQVHNLYGTSVVSSFTSIWPTFSPNLATLKLTKTQSYCLLFNWCHIEKGIIPVFELKMHFFFLLRKLSLLWITTGNGQGFLLFFKGKQLYYLQVPLANIQW